MILLFRNEAIIYKFQILVLSYGIEDSEELGSRVNKPGLRVSLTKSSNNKELYNSKETLVRCD